MTENRAEYRASRTSTTRRGEREIISVSLPVETFEALCFVCDRFHCNRSAVIASAIGMYIESLHGQIREG